MMNKAAMLVAALILAISLLAGCGQGNPPAPSNQSSTASQPAPAASSSPDAQGDVIFELSGGIDIMAGTWAAHRAGVQTSYYFFDEDKRSGSLLSVENGTGVGFEYEIDGTSAVFHMGAVDDNTAATLEQPGDDMLIITWEDGEQDILTYLVSASAENFTFYSNEALCEMALNHYEAASGYRPEFAAAIVNADDSVSIQLYDNLGDHNSSAAWYTVDRITGEGTNDITGEAVALSATDG